MVELSKIKKLNSLIKQLPKIKRSKETKKKFLTFTEYFKDEL